jgi:hypothetical protein
MIFTAIQVIALSSISLSADQDLYPQIALPNKCIMIAKPDGAISLCVKKANFTNKPLFTKRGYCELHLTIDETGKVKKVLPVKVKPRRKLESHCLKSAYNWKFDAPVNTSGEVVSVDRFFARIKLGKTKYDDNHPERDYIGISIDFRHTPED